MILPPLVFSALDLIPDFYHHLNSKLLGIKLIKVIQGTVGKARCQLVTVSRPRFPGASKLLFPVSYSTPKTLALINVQTALMTY